ncbi:SseB family protein [Leucobacter sp. HY1910]
MAIKRLPSTGDAPRSTGVPESLVPGGAADSAGFPWEGRTFDHHETAFEGDDGAAPAHLTEAVTALRKAAAEAAAATTAETHWEAVGRLAGAHADVIAALGTARVLVPMLAEAGDIGVTPEGKTVEKSQELSIVAVAAPDGRTVLPIFSSVVAMTAWNDTARPIPVPGPQAAVAAAQEEHDLLILDAGSPGLTYGVRRPAIAALALAERYVPAWADAEVSAAFEASAADEPDVARVWIAPADLAGTLAAPEVDVRIRISRELARPELEALLGRLGARWAAQEVIAERVDSLRVQPILAQAPRA